MGNLSFRQLDRLNEEKFFANRAGTRLAAVAIDTGFESILTYEENVPLEALGRQIRVVRCRVKQRVKGGQVVDPELGDPYYTDYYRRETQTDLGKPKQQIVLHFTAGALYGSLGALTRGRHNPDNPLGGVHFVVSTSGTIFELFPDDYWSHSSSAGEFNKQVISIEITNPGPLRMIGGDFYDLDERSNTFVCSGSEAQDVYDLAPREYRGSGFYYRYTPEQYEALRQIIGYITTKYPTIEYKLLEDDRPDKPEESQRYKTHDSRFMQGFSGIVSHVNYSGLNKYNRWEKWDIGPAFEWDELYPRRMAFPFQSRDVPLQSPPSLYFGNEVKASGTGEEAMPVTELKKARAGANYVLGAHRNVHGGIHVWPPGIPHDVRAMAPGVVVAARLSPAADNDDTKKFTGSYNGFVLIRHLFEEVPDPPPGGAAPRASAGTAGSSGSSPPPPPKYAIYSLYMHLAYPNWTATDDKDRYARVPWARRLLLARNGVMIDVDPASKHFGRLRWIKSTGVNNNSEKCELFDPTTLSAVPFAIQRDGRILGVVKKSPAPLSAGFTGLKGGKMITCHLPYLFVAGGEVIGQIDSKPSWESALHWEVFAPQGANNGIAKLLANVDRLSDKPDEKFGTAIGNRVVEDKNLNNYLEDSELRSLVNLAVTDPDELAALGDPCAEPMNIVEFDQKRATNTASFAGNIPPAPAGTTTPPFKGLVYGLTLHITRHFPAYKVHPNGPHEVLVEFWADETTKLTDFSQRIQVTFPNDTAADTTVTIAIPASANYIALSSSSFWIDAYPSSDRAQEKADELELVKAFLARRGRDVLLRHGSEWCEAKGDPLFDRVPRLDKIFDRGEVKKTLWWANSTEEQSVLAENQSIFSTAQPADPTVTWLPKDGKIDSLHPVTALWLMNLAVKYRKIKFAALKSQYSGLADRTLIYRAWAWSDAKVVTGDIVYAIAIRADFASSEFARFTARHPTLAQQLDLGQAGFTEGVAKLPVRVSFWGKWEVHAGVVDGSGGVWKKENLPSQIAGVSPSLSIPIPAPDLRGLTKPDRVKGNNAHYAASATFAANCPKAMKALVYFKCFSGPPGTAGATPAAPAASPFRLCDRAIIVEATRLSPSLNGLRMELNEREQWYIVGAAGKDSKVTNNFTFGTYYAVKSDPVDVPFRLSLELADIVEEVLASWTAAAATAGEARKPEVKCVTARWVTPIQRRADGLSITFHWLFKSRSKDLAAAAKRNEGKLLAGACNAVASTHKDSTGKPRLQASIDDPKGQLTLTLRDADVAQGDLDFTFDPTTLVDDFAAGVTPGDKVSVCAGFYAPNGGELAMRAEPAEYKPENSARPEIIVLGASLRNRIETSGDHGVSAPPVREQPFLEFPHVGFAETGYEMGPGSIVSSCLGGWLPKAWDGVKIEMKCNGAVVTHVRQKIPAGGIRFTATLNANDVKARGLLDQKLKLEVRVIEGALMNSAAPRTWTLQRSYRGGDPQPIPLTPSLESFVRVTDPKLPTTDPRRAVFDKLLAALKGASNDYVYFFGGACFVPTDVPLRVDILVRPEGQPFAKVTPVAGSIRYWPKHENSGSCDVDGSFAVAVARKALRDAASKVLKNLGKERTEAAINATEVKFVWSADAKAFGRTLADQPFGPVRVGDL